MIRGFFRLIGLLLLAGGFLVARVVRRHGGGTTVPVDDAQEW